MWTICQILRVTPFLIGPTNQPSFIYNYKLKVLDLLFILICHLQITEKDSNRCEHNIWQADLQQLWHALQSDRKF